MTNNFSQLRYVLCPGTHVHADFSLIHSKIYQCWSDVWTQAFQDLGAKKALYSDAFSRQNYVGGLFSGDDCVALCFFREAHANAPEFAKDSYFSNWSPAHLETLTSRGPKVIVCS